MWDPYAGAPGRSALRGGDGRTLLGYTPGAAFDGRSWAVAVCVQPPFGDEAVRAALTAFAGWRLSTADSRLAGALLDAGALQERLAATLEITLAARRFEQRPLADVHIEPLTPRQVDRHALALAEVAERAYPPTHPDAAPTQSAMASRLRAMARGEILGPMTEESRIALWRGRIAGACLTIEPTDGILDDSGCWVADLFRDPATPRGTGEALLTASLAAAAEAGIERAALQVSDGNDSARRLYERIGFTATERSWTLTVPG